MAEKTFPPARSIRQNGFCWTKNISLSNKRPTKRQNQLKLLSVPLCLCGKKSKRDHPVATHTAHPCYPDLKPPLNNSISRVAPPQPDGQKNFSLGHKNCHSSVPFVPLWLIHSVNSVYSVVKKEFPNATIQSPPTPHPCYPVLNTRRLTTPYPARAAPAKLPSCRKNFSLGKVHPAKWLLLDKKYFPFQLDVQQNAKISSSFSLCLCASVAKNPNATIQSPHHTPPMLP